MFFVERLRKPQGIFGGEAKTCIGLTLKAGQIKKCWSGLRGGLALLANNCGLMKAGAGDRFRVGGLP